jgi:hypothetical protein
MMFALLAPYQRLPPSWLALGLIAIPFLRRLVNDIRMTVTLGLFGQA